MELYPLPDISANKWRQMRWVGQVRNAYNILIGKPDGKNHFEDLGIDGG
jgi:hypothetical protein